LANNAKNMGFGIADSSIVKNELFYKTTAEALKEKAIQAYPTKYGRP
jgi:hypothetical protein